MTAIDAAPDGAGTAAGAPPALRVTDLVSGYDRTTVVREVSVEVPSETVVALVGPNGAGKTTLIKTISGLLPARAGTIEMFGEDVTHQPPERRSSSYICTVPEGRGIYRSLTVRENLVLQTPKGSEADGIERATSAFPVLGERLKQQAGTLSGGEQQMLALAAAHVRDPRLVVVDEASLGLAPIVVDLMFEFIQRLGEQGTAMLIVDQFVHRVLDVASSVYVLSRGVIEFAGSPAAFLEGDLFERYLGGGTG